MSRCPICAKETVLPTDEGQTPGFSPFCSSRCKDIDLYKWFSGTYAISTEEIPSGEEEV